MKKVAKRIAIIFVLLVILVSTCACGKKIETQTETNDKYRYIYFSTEDGSFCGDLEEDIVYKWSVLNEWLEWSDNVMLFMEEYETTNVSFN